MPMKRQEGGCGSAGNKGRRLERKIMENGGESVRERESAMRVNEELTWKIRRESAERREGASLRLLCALIVPSFVEESSKNSKDFFLL
jgi:hypothetical protein